MSGRETATSTAQEGGGSLRAAIWGVAALWLMLFAWCVYVVVSVSGLRAEVEDAVGWIGAAEEMRGELVTAAASIAGGGDADAELPGELASTELVSSAPSYGPERRRAIRRWRPLADGLTASLVVLDDPNATAAEREAARTAIAARQLPQLNSVLQDLVGDVRARLRDRSIQLGSFWSALYLATGLCLVSAAALFVLALRLRRQQIELTAARDRAQAETQAKDRFLATMSHEIRTPLNAVVGMSQLLAKTDLGPAQQEYVRTLDDSARVLLSVIEDVLDMSRIERDAFDLQHAPFDLRDACEATLRILRSRADARDTRLSLAYPDGAPTSFVGDDGRVRQLLLNLAGNAVKFTNNGNVWLEVTVDPGRGPGRSRVHVAVADDGIGIDPHILPRLVQPFAQADSSTTRRYGGAGLGLAICDRFVDAMGGELGASGVPGVGTAFWFAVELAHAPSAARPESAAADVASGLRVLVVDDSALNRRVARAMLEQLGCAVDGADGADAALEQVRASRYDLVFMDLHMPDVDGFEATRTLRAADDRATLRICAMTADAQAGTRARCLAAGMDDYVTKPLATAELRRVLDGRG